MKFVYEPYIDSNKNFVKRFSDSYLDIPNIMEKAQKVLIPSFNLLDKELGIFTYNPILEFLFLSISNQSSFNGLTLPCNKILIFQTGIFNEKDEILVKNSEITVSEKLLYNFYISGKFSKNGSTINEFFENAKIYSNFTRNAIIKISKLKTLDELSSIIKYVENYNFC